MNKKEKIPKEVKEVVVAKIDAQMPSNLKLSIGSYGTMNKEEMIEHVNKGDLIGRQIVRAHISFLKAIASGEFAKTMVSVEK